MSLNSAMQAGVSGLVANSNALSTIASNIANVNTVGYKQSGTDFESLVTSASDSSDSSGGVLASTRQLVNQQGQLIQSSSPLDLAISGQGFFVTTTSASTVSPTQPALFTRAGSFQVNNQGFLVNSAGLVLQGWLANAAGVITPNPSNLTSLQPINVSQVGGAVQPTTTIGINANVDSSQTALAPATYNPAVAADSMASGAVTPDFTIQVPVSDSLGGQHTIQFDFLKTSTANTWDVEVVASNPADVNSGAAPAGQIAAGQIAFTSTGQINLAAGGGTTLFASNANPSLTINWAAALGVTTPQTISLNLTGGAGSTGGLTQLNSQSVTQSITTNGTAFGNLTNVQVNANGIVTAVFSNGVTRPIAQVAIATFPNPDGLTAVNGDAYQVSQNSGTFTLEQPGIGGAGQIDPSALESSTVDLSSQLTDLITSQSAYSASSKIITTADQMIQALLNVIQ
jgi:flagellar hook protein FlgE